MGVPHEERTHLFVDEASRPAHTPQAKLRKSGNLTWVRMRDIAISISNTNAKEEEASHVYCTSVPRACTLGVCDRALVFEEQEKLPSWQQEHATNLRSLARGSAPTKQRNKYVQKLYPSYRTLVVLVQPKRVSFAIKHHEIAKAQPSAVHYVTKVWGSINNVEVPPGNGRSGGAKSRFPSYVRRGIFEKICGEKKQEDPSSGRTSRTFEL